MLCLNSRFCVDCCLCMDIGRCVVSAYSFNTSFTRRRCCASVSSCACACALVCQVRHLFWLQWSKLRDGMGVSVGSQCMHTEQRCVIARVRCGLFIADDIEHCAVYVFMHSERRLHRFADS